MSSITKEKYTKLKEDIKKLKEEYDMLKKISVEEMWINDLIELEKELGYTMASSPTVNVGYEVLSELPKERHEKPMLSLDKTTEIGRLKEFVGKQTALLSWKMDGLTNVITYNNGEISLKKRTGKVAELKKLSDEITALNTELSELEQKQMNILLMLIAHRSMVLLTKQNLTQIMQSL